MNQAAAGHGKGPKSTPVLDGRGLYTMSITGVLTAYDVGTGQVRWRKAFADQFPHASPTFGAAMSPAVDQGVVFAHVGGDGKGALAAFDAVTGKVRWTWDQDGPGYASPVVATFSGTRQVITQTQRSIVSVSAADGKRLWSLPFTTDYEQNSVTPLVFRDTLIFSGLDRGTFALRPVNRGGAWSIVRAWQNDDVSMYMSSPVLAGDRVVGFSHKTKGAFFAVDATTGRTLWIGDGRQGDNAALVSAGALVFLLTNDAQLTVGKPVTSGIEPVRRYDVADSQTWAHPVVLNDGFLIKDESSLTYWMLK